MKKTQQIDYNVGAWHEWSIKIKLRWPTRQYILKLASYVKVTNIEQA
jgi:hypothetical protein